MSAFFTYVRLAASHATESDVITPRGRHRGTERGSGEAGAARSQVLRSMTTYTSGKAFEEALDWLNQWACSRSFGLGTRCCPLFPFPSPPTFPLPCALSAPSAGKTCNYS